MLMDEAGGVKTRARDVAQWVQLNLQADQQLRLCCKAGIQRATAVRAICADVSGLGWEMLDYPVTLTALTAVTAPDFVKGHAATLLDPASGARASWVHKTSATGGFGAYAALFRRGRWG